MANIGNGLPYIPSGFRLDGSVAEGDVMWFNQSTNKTVTQGMALKNTGGTVESMGAAFASTFIGIALFAQTTVGTSLPIAVITPNPNKFFWAPVLSATLVTSSAVGTMVDLNGSGAIGVDITDTTLVSWGFEIVDIDASTLAVAANAAGFVKGRFLQQPQ